jgi:hypothetical protein
MKKLAQIMAVSLSIIVSIYSQNAGTDIQIYPTSDTQQAEVSIAVHPTNNRIVN